MRHVIRDAKGRFCKAETKTTKKNNKRTKQTKGFVLRETDDLKISQIIEGSVRFYLSVDDLLKDNRFINIEGRPKSIYEIKTKRPIQKPTDYLDKLHNVYTTQDVEVVRKLSIDCIKRALEHLTSSILYEEDDVVRHENNAVMLGDYATHLCSEGNETSIQTGHHAIQVSTAGYDTSLIQTGDYSKQALVGEGDSYTEGSRCTSVSMTTCATMTSVGDQNVLAALYCVSDEDPGCSTWVKGRVGDMLILVERDDVGKPLAGICAFVDNKEVKEDTWYTIRYGKLVEVKIK